MANGRSQFLPWWTFMLNSPFHPSLWNHNPQNRHLSQQISAKSLTSGGKEAEAKEAKPSSKWLVEWLGFLIWVEKDRSL